MARVNEHGLTPAQEVFAVELASGKTQSDAYRKAYPASLKWKVDGLHNKASALARDVRVRARVAGLQAQVASKTVLEAASIKAEIARLALSDISEIMDAEGKMLPPHKLPLDVRRSIASIKVDEFGRIEYKFWPKNAALDQAAKILGLYEKDNAQQAAKVPLRIELVPLMAASTAPVADKDD